MGYYLQIDAKDEVSLASNQGWNDVTRWAETLPATYPDLHHLCQHGWTGNVNALTEQITLAQHYHAPQQEDVASTLVNFINTLQSEGKNAEVVSVTNGIG